MKITSVTSKFRNVERNLLCDVLHITTVRVARLVLDCNSVFAIKAYGMEHLCQYHIGVDLVGPVLHGGGVSGPVLHGGGVSGPVLHGGGVLGPL